MSPRPTRTLTCAIFLPATSVGAHLFRDVWGSFTRLNSKTYCQTRATCIKCAKAAAAAAAAVAGQKLISRRRRFQAPTITSSSRHGVIWVRGVAQVPAPPCLVGCANHFHLHVGDLSYGRSRGVLVGAVYEHPRTDRKAYPVYGFCGQSRTFVIVLAMASCFTPTTLRRLRTTVHLGEISTMTLTANAPSPHSIALNHRVTPTLVVDPETAFFGTASTSGICILSR